MTDDGASAHDRDRITVELVEPTVVAEIGALKTA
jgi:hypothetical protein